MNRAAAHRGDVRRILVAGDTHGNTKWVRHLTDVATRNDCPVIIQVGDFGYFPVHPDGPRFLTATDRACAANGVDLWFIDGNHDDHTSLAKLEHGHVPVNVAEHVTYLPRGTRLHLGGRTFGFLGGAFSVDWRYRTAGIDWWQHEVTDTDDVLRLGTERLDVLIAHEAPAGIALSSSWKLPAEDQVRADEVRALVAQAATATSPGLVIHGHWHHGYQSELNWIDRATTDRTGTLTFIPLRRGVRRSMWLRRSWLGTCRTSRVDRAAPQTANAIGCAPRDRGSTALPQHRCRVIGASG